MVAYILDILTAAMPGESRLWIKINVTPFPPYDISPQWSQKNFVTNPDVQYMYSSKDRIVV